MLRHLERRDPVGVTSFSYPMANATTSGDIMDDIIPEVTSSDYALVMMVSPGCSLLVGHDDVAHQGLASTHALLLPSSPPTSPFTSSGSYLGGRGGGSGGGAGAATSSTAFV